MIVKILQIFNRKLFALLICLVRSNHRLIFTFGPSKHTSIIAIVDPGMEAQAINMDDFREEVCDQ